MKNLLLIVPMLHQGGFERVCVETARLLKDRYNVTILIFSSRDIHYDITGLNVIDIDVPSRKGKLNKILGVLRRTAKVRKIRREKQIDLCYSFGSSANFVNVLSGKGFLPGVSSGKYGKTVTGLRCSTDVDAEKEVRLFLSRSDAVLSCSKEIVRCLERNFGYRNGRFIYNPLEAEEIRLKGGEEITDFPFEEQRGKGQIIITVGRADRIKGIWHLIKAFSRLEGKFPEARLIVVGTGNWEPYRKLAEDLGIGDKVAFTGVKKNPFPYVQRADIYCLPSNHEGFPNALLEGMALGRPIAACDCRTGPREILLPEREYEELAERCPYGTTTDTVIEGDYGILVPDMSDEPDFDASRLPDEELPLTKALEELLGDPEKREKLGRAAALHAKDYSPEKYASDLSDLLEDMASH